MIEERITDPIVVASEPVRAIIESGRRPTIQFSKPGYSPELLAVVNELCLEFGDKLEVRFYGHYQGGFDASVLTRLPDVRWLSVDCLIEIENERQISELASLRKLAFGVYRFDNPNFLKTLPLSKLTRLSLGETAKRNLDLEPLSSAANLQRLYLEGHQKNIQALSELPCLSDLVLRAISNRQSLGFASAIRSLRSLEIVLGGRTSIDEVEHAELDSLEVIRVRGLESVGSLTRFPSLRRLIVQDQIQIGSIDLNGPKLREVRLVNCKTLRNLQGIEAQDELVAFSVYQTSLDLPPLLDLNWPASLKALALYSNSDKWNKAARAILDSRGYRQFAHQL